MKTETSGLSESTIHNKTPEQHPLTAKFRCPQALDTYKKERTNGDQQDSPARRFPNDGRYTWYQGKTAGKGCYHYHIKYTQGPRDDAWMKERDRNYVFRLEREGNLDVKEPKLSTENPNLYAEVMTYRAKEEQRLKEERREQELEEFRERLRRLEKEKDSAKDKDRTIEELREKIRFLQDERLSFAKKPQFAMAMESPSVTFPHLSDDKVAIMESPESKNEFLLEEEILDSPAEKSVMEESIPLNELSSSLTSTQLEEFSVSSLTLLPKLKVAYELPFSDLSDKSSWKRLGSGGFGEVFLAKYQYNAVAIKALLSHQLSAEGTEEFKREITLMADLRHPQVVQFYGACIQGQQYYLVMEYMPKGSLYQILHDKNLDNTSFHWSLRFQIALDVGKGLMYLHNKEILHRDLKSLNVLLGANYEAKLTDFGLAKVKSETASTTKNSGVVGSVLWLAPELFQRGAQHTKASDMYSYGMVLWEIASRKKPWEDAANPSIVPTWVLQGERETLPPQTPAKMAEVIRYCWFGEAQKRFNAAQAVERLSSVQESSQGVEQHIHTPKQGNSFLGNLSSRGQSRPF